MARCRADPTTAASPSAVPQAPHLRPGAIRRRQCRIALGDQLRQLVADACLLGRVGWRDSGSASARSPWC
jgi:hypothetical protein